VSFEPVMAMRTTWKEMMSMKTMMAMYARKYQTTQTSTFDNLWDWIVGPTIDQAVSIKLLYRY
jgi:hypothetical protein